jgi:hypothetical protein
VVSRSCHSSGQHDELVIKQNSRGDQSAPQSVHAFRPDAVGRFVAAQLGDHIGCAVRGSPGFSVAAHQCASSGIGFDAALLPACAWLAVGEYRDVPEFSRDSLGAVHDLSGGDDAGRDAGAQYDNEHFIDPGRVAETEFRETCGPYVVLQGDRDRELFLDGTGESNITKTQIRCEVHDAGSAVDKARGADSDGFGVDSCECAGGGRDGVNNCPGTLSNGGGEPQGLLDSPLSVESGRLDGGAAEIDGDHARVLVHQYLCDAGSCRAKAGRELRLVGAVRDGGEVVMSRS